MIRTLLALCATAAVLLAPAAPAERAEAAASPGVVTVVGHPRSGEFTLVTAAGRRTRVPAAGDVIVARCLPERSPVARWACAWRAAARAEALARRTPYDPAHWVAQVSPVVADELGVHRASIEVYGGTTVVLDAGSLRVLTS